jgi:hypothetical protein
MQHCNDKLSGPHVGKDPNVCSLARKLCPFIGPSMRRRREMNGLIMGRRRKKLDNPLALFGLKSGQLVNAKLRERAAFRDGRYLDLCKARACEGKLLLGS